MVRHAIVGSRHFWDLDMVATYVGMLPLDTVIVSGGAAGVDVRATVAAVKRGMPKPIVFLPDWDRYGKRAGPLRNQQIVDECDILTAFWDGRSPGTADSIRRATYAGKLFKVFAFGDALIVPG